MLVQKKAHLALVMITNNNGLNSIVQFGDITRKLNNQKHLRHDHKSYKKK